MQDILTIIFTVLLLAVPCFFLTFWFFKVGRYWGLAGGLIVFFLLILGFFLPSDSAMRGFASFIGFVLPLIGAHLRIRKLQKECESLKSLVDQC